MPNLPAQGSTDWFAHYTALDRTARAVGVIQGLLSATTADNASILQAAIDATAAAGGGTVQLPSGTYLTGPLRLKSRVRLAGTGFGTVLKLKNSANAHFITLDSVQVFQVGLEDLVLDGNKANQTGTWNVLHLAQTGYSGADGTTFFDDDTNHYFRHVGIINSRGHGVYADGVRGANQFISVLVFDSTNQGFHIESPDNVFDHCIAGNNGQQGWRLQGNGSSNRLVGCKSFLSGRNDQSNAAGFHCEFTSRTDMTHCEAQDNRGAGFAINGETFASFVNCKADRNGLGPEPVTGGQGDGIYVAGTTNSIFIMTLGDRGSSDGTNPGALLQSRGYNCGSGNNGNIVDLAIGPTKTGVAGVGTWGAQSYTRVIFNKTLFTPATS